MRHRFATVLASIFCLGLCVAAFTQAESRIYYNAGVAAYGAVSGTPRSTLSFSGAYSSGGGEYCEGVQTGAKYEGINSLLHSACTNGGSSVTSSFAAESGRAVLVNGFKVQKIAGEERW